MMAVWHPIFNKYGMRIDEIMGNVIDWNPRAPNPNLQLFNLDVAAHSGKLDTKDRGAFVSFLNSHRNDFVRMYHGTSEIHPVMDKGLLPTTDTRKKSFQSSNGYVYLAYDPQSALSFARMAYAGLTAKTLVVYAVEVTIGRLKADHDQLANKRFYTDHEIGNGLADSLIYGRGARVKGRIDPMQITIFGEYNRDGSLLEMSK